MKLNGARGVRYRRNNGCSWYLRLNGEPISGASWLSLEKDRLRWGRSVGASPGAGVGRGASEPLPVLPVLMNALVENMVTSRSDACAFVSDADA